MIRFAIISESKRKLQGILFQLENQKSEDKSGTIKIRRFRVVGHIFKRPSASENY